MMIFSFLVITVTNIFYDAYREQINSMKREINTALHHNNAAFCGFLMMVLENTEGIFK